MKDCLALFTQSEGMTDRMFKTDVKVFVRWSTPWLPQFCLFQFIFILKKDKIEVPPQGVNQRLE